MHSGLSDDALNQLFFDARTPNFWLERAVPDALLRRVVDLMKMAPTSANCSPVRFVFLRTPDAKAKLKPHLAVPNVEKTMTAPVTAIIATDYLFYDQLPKLFPHTDARSWFSGDKDLADITASRNATLQGGYFILAARALGLDCGPMSGFNNAALDSAFFAGTAIKSNFLCNLGYGDPAKLWPRSPRLDFDEIAKIL